MSARVSIRVAGGPDRRDATALAVKSASTPEEISRLAAEAERLQQITHPGVVCYVDHRQDDDGAELHTVYAGEPLERWRGTLEQAAGLVAALATNLADLHEASVVHGRIDRSHVLRGPQGRPVLCGLSPPPTGAEPATDVAAVGHLLRDLLDEAAAAIRQSSRVPWRSWLRLKKARQALERVAAHAADPLATRRPPVRALATAILEAVPDAELPAPDAATSTGVVIDAAPDAQLSEHGGAQLERGGDAETDLFERAFVDQRDTGEDEIFIDRPWQDTGPNPIVMQVGTWRSVIGALILAGIGALVVGRVLLTGTDPAPQRDLPGAASAPDPAGPECPDTSGDETGELADETGATTWADTDGDGCAERVTITADGVVQVAGERWAVGRQGDEITLGDWDCDGSSTPAVYRQSTGDVFVFEAWAGRGRPLEVEPVGQVLGGVSLGTTRPDCDVPVVELASGARRSVEVRP